MERKSVSRCLLASSFQLPDTEVERKYYIGQSSLHSSLSLPVHPALPALARMESKVFDGSYTLTGLDCRRLDELGTLLPIGRKPVGSPEVGGTSAGSDNHGAVCALGFHFWALIQQ